MSDTDRLLMPREMRFWYRVQQGQPDDCWEWTGARSNGYGVMTGGRRGTRLIYVHRFSYELHVGPIAPGMVIDHLCRNRACTNPAHMEVVTRGENTLRGDSMSGRNARKTHCPNGHPYDVANTAVNAKGHRRCKLCRRKWWINHRLQGRSGAD